MFAHPAAVLILPLAVAVAVAAVLALVLQQRQRLAVPQLLLLRLPRYPLLRLRRRLPLPEEASPSMDSMVAQGGLGLALALLLQPVQSSMPTIPNAYRHILGARTLKV